MTAPYVPFYPSDWLAGVASLTPAEVGVYINILALIYENDGPVPYDVKRLSRRMGINAGPLKKIVTALIDEGKLVDEHGSLTNLRAEKEIQERLSKSAIAKQNAFARWKKIKQKQQKSNADASIPQCKTDANQNQNQKEKEDTNVSSKKGSRLSPDWVPASETIQAAIDAGLSKSEALKQADRFRDYWIGVSGAKGVKRDWPATWRNWCRRRADELGFSGKSNDTPDGFTRDRNGALVRNNTPKQEAASHENRVGNAERGGDRNSLKCDWQSSGDVSAVQPAPEEIEGYVSFGDDRGGRDTGLLPPLQLESC